MFSLSNFIKLIVVIVLIALDVFRNLTMYSRGQPIRTKCSPDYPEFSVRIDYPEDLPDGGVKQGSDGEVYPRGTWWEMNGEVRGCPCSRGRPCIRKCCAVGESWFWNKDRFYCVPDSKLNFTKSLEVYKERFAKRLEQIEVSAKSFDIIAKACEGTISPVEFILIQDGTIKSPGTLLQIHQSQFCVEFLKDDHVFVVNICGPLEEFLKPFHINKVLKWIPYLSIPILAFTLFVYALVPRLRRGYGTAVMCYLASEIVRKSDYALKEEEIGISECTIYSSFIPQFAILSAQAWLVVISYIIWSMTSASGFSSQLESRSSFLIPYGLALGIPFAIATLAEAADRVPGVPDILKPRFRTETYCFFQNDDAKLIYSILPQIAGILATLVLCVATLVRLVGSKRNSEGLQNSESRCHNATEIQWSNLFLKVILIMGIHQLVNMSVPWLTYVVAVHPAVFYTSIDIINVKGVEVFLIFVCRKDILTMFFQSIAFWRK